LVQTSGIGPPLELAATLDAALDAADDAALLDDALVLDAAAPPEPAPELLVPPPLPVAAVLASPPQAPSGSTARAAIAPAASAAGPPAYPHDRRNLMRHWVTRAQGCQGRHGPRARPRDTGGPAASSEGRPMSLESSVLLDVAELEALRPAWDDLLASSASDEPMLSPLWLLSWWRVFGALDGRRLAVVACHDGGRLVGLAPLLLRTHRYPPAIPFRRLELLGTGEREADEVCSEYVGVLAARGAEASVAGALAEALARGALGPWDELVLTAMDGTGPMPALLGAALGRAGIIAEIESIGSAPYIALPRTFAEYLTALSPSSRYLITRSRRDLDRWAGAGLALHLASTPAELDAGRAALHALHGERWGGAGAFVSPRFTAFHDAVMPGLLARGSLELAWLTVRGEPLAAAYGIVWRGKVYFYQAGRSLAVPKGLRPGIAMHARLIERATELGRHEYDFLDGHSRYKRQLATAARSIVRLRAVRVRDGLRERTRKLAERGIAEGRMLERLITKPSPPSGKPEPEIATPRPAAVLLGDLNMLRCFAGSGVRTVVLASDADAPIFFSRHCGQRRLVTDLHVDAAAALADLLALGRLFDDRPVFYYGDDAALLLVSRHREALAARYRFLLPDAELVEALVDKTRFALLARERGLPAPRTVASTEARTAAEVARLLSPPWILKPFCHLGFRTSRAVTGLGVGPVKALRADSEGELARMIERLESFSSGFVVQEYIPGGEEHVYSFHAYLDARGRPLGSFEGRKIRTYPRHAGTSTYLEIVDEPELARAGLDVLARLGLVGVAKLDFKRDPGTGRFHLLEVNPRFSLWNHLGAAAGVNLPLLAHGDLTGAPPPPVQRARPGVRWLSLGDDARVFLREYAPSGELSLGGWLLSLRGPKVYDLFAWDDATPFLHNLARAVGARARLPGARR
jgi:predicted ATP-grasp superfamily ATP-dependent carboligase/CelD/BcsL family acetyltransferase involved in cellulose biosynthesis